MPASFNDSPAANCTLEDNYDRYYRAGRASGEAVMGYVEEDLLPRIYDALKEQQHPLAEEMETVLGYKTDAQRAALQAEHEQSLTVAETQGVDAPTSTPAGNQAEARITWPS